MTGHCKDCKHWLPFDGERFNSTIVRANRLGLCGQISYALDRADEADTVPTDVIALCEDASDYRHDLRTAAEFGCVLFEAK